MEIIVGTVARPLYSVTSLRTICLVGDVVIRLTRRHRSVPSLVARAPLGEVWPTVVAVAEDDGLPA